MSFESDADNSQSTSLHFPRGLVTAQTTRQAQRDVAELISTDKPVQATQAKDGCHGNESQDRGHSFPLMIFFCLRARADCSATGSSVLFHSAMNIVRSENPTFGCLGHLNMPRILVKASVLQNLGKERAARDSRHGEAVRRKLRDMMARL